MIVIFALVSMIHNSFSDNSTQAKFCNKGVCSTGNTKSLVTIPNGIFLHNSQRIGIQLSQACIKMLEFNITSNCLSYKDLKALDTTNTFIAGQWTDKPYYHRLPPRVLDAYRFITNPVFVVMVDPDPLFTTKARMIIVTNSNFTYINPNDISVNGLKITTHHNRSVVNCDLATVAPNVWLVNDTVKYLESDCTNTKYNDTSFTYQKDIPFSYDNPYSSLHYNIAKLKSNMHSTQNCITKQCPKTKDPYSKW